ncbi:MAG: tetratricopeptide repeat protein [Terracidiphilus sp.]
MRTFESPRTLPAFAVLIALFTAPFVAHAQAPTLNAVNTSPTEVAAGIPNINPTPTAEELGDTLAVHQRYQEAIESYLKAPGGSSTVWNKMGIAYQMMFNLQEATRCYRESLKIDPNNPNVFNNLGTVYDSLRDYRSAVKMYHKALKIDPKSPLVLKNLGTDLLAQHKYEKGWAYYKAALAVNPEIFGVESGPRVQNPSSVQQRGAMNYYMAKSCARAGLNARAIQYLRMALNEGFTNPQKIIADSEFASLRGVADFEKLLNDQKEQ